MYVRMLPELSRRISASRSVHLKTPIQRIGQTSSETCSLHVCRRPVFCLFHGEENVFRRLWFHLRRTRGLPTRSECSDRTQTDNARVRATTHHTTPDFHFSVAEEIVSHSNKINQTTALHSAQLDIVRCRSARILLCNVPAKHKSLICKSGTRTPEPAPQSP